MKELLTRPETKPTKKKRAPLWALVGVPAVIVAVICTIVFFPSREPAKPTEPTAPTDTSPYIYYAGTRLPINEDVDINNYATEAFSADNGFIRYASPDAQYGIDVSTHQGEIDWQAVADSGIDFAIIRIGYRGYTEGDIFLDDCFVQNIDGAIAADIDVGVYFFSQAVTNREAEEEAYFVLEALRGYELTYPVVFDWELIYEEEARTKDVTGTELTEFARAFCDAVKQKGYTPAIYFNTEMGYLYYDMGKIAGYDLWLAEYDSYPEFYYNFQMWQYTAQGKIPGITASVDVNISMVDYSAAE